MPPDSLVIVAIIVMLSLALGIVLFIILYQRRVINHQVQIRKLNIQKELELTQASIQSAEEERRRIASELHDDVAATLASARLFLYKSKDASFSENSINQSKELLDESINKIRDISHKLQPATLQHLGLQLGLQSLIELINKSEKIRAEFVVKNPLTRINDTIELAAYRISQELINNIIKHADATNIKMETGTEQQNIVIILLHDGSGLTQEMYEDLVYKKGATGLKNIVNRLKAVNGLIQFYKEDGKWYKTVLSVPITEIKETI